MAEAKNLPPKIYHANDPDEIFAFWRSLVEKMQIDEKAYGQDYLKIFDPDQAPEVYVDLMLRNLGNPFTEIFLPLEQRRKLVKTLIPIFRQKGTARGIVNAVRFLLGIIVEITDPHGIEEHSWRVGISEIGQTTFVGGDRVYCNILDWTEDFANAVWTKSGASVVSDAVQGPLPWVRPADRLIMTNANDEIYQTVTPLNVDYEPFTATIWLKGDAPDTIDLSIEAASDPTDKTTETLNITTEWQRFDVMHQMHPNQGSLDVIYRVKTTSGIPGNIYAWGAQLVRNDEIQPYAPSEDDGADCEDPGRWAYHFFIITDVELTEEQERLIRVIADYMKTAHTHYTLVFPGEEEIPAVFNHWEVGISEIGLNTYVHDV